MTTSGRNPSRRERMRGVRQGGVLRAEAAGAAYRTQRPGSSMRGIAFLLVLILIIGALGLFVGVPMFRGLARGLADSDPNKVTLPFVGEIVREDLGDELVKPAGTSDAIVPFVISAGDTPKQIAAALADAHLVAEPLVFEYLVVTQNVGAKLKQGTFNLRQSMTPQQIVDRLQQNPEPPPPQAAVAVQASRRIEQIVATLENAGLSMNVKDWYDYVQKPPASLATDYPWLSELPSGRSLEGFLGIGVVFQVEHNVTPEAFTRLLLDQWDKTVGQGVVDEAKAKKKNFYEVLTLASIVERETGTDSERAKIAGVYVNRLNGLNNGVKLLNADPTVVYATDTAKLRSIDISQWTNYLFWGLLGVPDLSQVQVPSDLTGYQTYVNTGLPPGPIDSPSKASIEAAINPDTNGKYLYFYACPGDKTHKFAKTLAEQSRNIASCK